MGEATVVVTGGAGFIGSHLVAHLIRQGHQTLAIDNLSSGKLNNYSQLGITPDFIQGDVADPTVLEQLAHHSIRTIYHLAAQASVPLSVRSPVQDFEINVRGTLNILEFARKHKAQVIFPSTVSVYAKESPKPIPETAVIHASSPYGAAKVAGENYCFAYANCYGVRTVVARLFNVYGPLMSKYVIHDFVRKLQTNPKAITIIGDGNQVRDYLHVVDAIRALDLLAKSGESGTVYNIGSGTPTRIIDLACLIADELGLSDVEIICSGERVMGDIQEWFADIKRIRQLGFEQLVPFREGLKQTVRFIIEGDSVKAGIK